MPKATQIGLGILPNIMSLEDVDFESEWERFKKEVGSSYFLKYHDHIGIIIPEKQHKMYALDIEIVDIWISLSLVELVPTAKTSWNSIWRINPEKNK